MKYNLYLDDERFPKLDNNWVIVRSFEEFKSCILEKGLFQEASLDHDLGEDEFGKLLPTGYDCLKWLLDSDYDISNVEINFHTSNLYGKLNMESLVNTWHKVKNL